VGDYTRAQLEAVVQPGAVVDNGYSVYTLDLFSDGVPTRATVTIPFGATVPSGGWHLVANAHGTVGVEDPCAVAGTVAGAGLAGLFGARGLIGVAPEYPGLGTPGVHPYLVAQSEGRAVLDAVRATLQLAGYLKVAVSGRTAIVGLSQGGHAALSAGRERQAWAPELDVRAISASGPASVFQEHWRMGVNVDGPHLAMHAMLVYAWARHYGDGGPSPWSAARQPDIDTIMAQHCAFSVSGEATLSQLLGSQADQIFSPGFLAAYRTGAWGAWAAFDGYFTLNRARPWAQTAPLRIYQGSADDTVLEFATRELVGSLRDGGMTLDYVVVPDGGHVDVAYGFLAYPQLRTEESLAWLKAQL
jgi:S-formylglutathione hydrolase FrmB